MAVYLGFDSVAAFPIWKRIGEPREWAARLIPRENRSIAAPGAVRLRWESDSSIIIAEAAWPAVLDSTFPLGSDAAREIRDVAGRAAILRSDYGAGSSAASPDGSTARSAPDSFSARFERIRDLADQAPRFTLVRLDLQGAERISLEKRETDRGPRFCAGDRCLGNPPPRSPLQRYAGVVRKSVAVETFTGAAGSVAERPAIRMTAAEGSPVHPILRGRIVSARGSGDTSDWIGLHHGGNLFSFYRGIERLDDSIRIGTMVEPGETLGWLASEAGEAGLEIRIESRGAAVDPLAYLGLAIPDTGRTP